MKNEMLAATMLALFAAPVCAGTHALLPAQAGDLVPATLSASTTVAAPTARSAGSPVVRAPMPRRERRPVSINWALPHDQPVQSEPTPFAPSSREYWIDVSATELQRGVALPLSAPGAVIRLSPGDPQGGRLDASGVRLRLGRQALNLQQASSTLADAASLQAAGMAVPEASMVFKLKAELGSGLATLQAPAASGRYVVHVLEPQSEFSVAATGERSELLAGQQMHVRVAMRANDKAAPLVAVGGFLRSPDGSTTTLAYRQQADGNFTTSVRPPVASSTPGLWEVHSFSAGLDAEGHEVRRDTTTVFAVAAPTARFSGTASTARASDRGIDIALAVDTARAGRYAASAVLYGRAADGRMVPAAFAQSAAVLRAGSGRLVLHFGPASLSGVGAPYDLRDLRLQDQSALSLVERQAVALRFDAP